MRWTSWILAVTVIGLAGPAAGYQPGCVGCNGGMTAQQGLDAEACASPGDYCLTPGCCEDHRPCCDNAWAGYCDHRAKVEAFWARVGAPKSCGRGKICRPTPVASDVPCPCSTETMQPTPAVPAPTPAKPAALRTPYLPRPIR
jgi:hypothetical protein